MYTCNHLSLILQFNALGCMSTCSACIIVFVFTTVQTVAYKQLPNLGYYLIMGCSVYAEIQIDGGSRK